MKKLQSWTTFLGSNAGRRLGISVVDTSTRERGKPSSSYVPTDVMNGFTLPSRPPCSSLLARCSERQSGPSFRCQRHTRLSIRRMTSEVTELLPHPHPQQERERSLKKKQNEKEKEHACPNGAANTCGFDTFSKLAKFVHPLRPRQSRFLLRHRTSPHAVLALLKNSALDHPFDDQP